MNLRTIAPFVFGAALAAQGTTWIVDINNGAGAHFTSLVTAVASVNDGDTLVVRAGAYHGNVATGKALTILGQGQVDVYATTGSRLPAVTVQGLAAGRTFTCKNVSIGATIEPAALALQNNAGRIHLEGVRAEGPSLNGTVAPAGLSVENCPAVTLAACRTYGFPGVRAVASTLVFTDCVLAGGDWCGSIRCFSSSVGLVALNSTIFLAQTTVTGGNGGGVVIPVANRSAIGGTDCTLFVTGDTAARIVAGFGPNPVPAVDLLGGTLTIDPTVTVLGANAPPIVSTGAVLRRRVAGLLGRGGPPGGVLTATLLSPAGAPFVIAASSVVDPIALPIGLLLIDTGAMVPLLYGTQGATERTAVSISVPLLPMLQGVVIGMQAISVDPTNLAAELTNPAVVVLY